MNYTHISTAPGQIFIPFPHSEKLARSLEVRFDWKQRRTSYSKMEPLEALSRACASVYLEEYELLKKKPHLVHVTQLDGWYCTMLGDKMFERTAIERLAKDSIS